jgi:hypothetical protein
VPTDTESPVPVVVGPRRTRKAKAETESKIS